MSKHLAIVAAAALTLGGVSLTWAEDESLKDKTKDTAAGVRDKTAETVGIGSADQASQHQSKNAEDIHDVLAQVAEAAMTKDGLDDMVERFVDADRNRIGQNKDALDDDALDGKLEQLANDWKAKYNSEFDIKDEDKVYNLAFAQIIEGEIGDRARTAGEKLEGDINKTDAGTSGAARVGDVSADAKVDADAGTARVNVDNNTGVDAPKANTDGQTAADTNRNDPGRNIATVRIAESHGLPALDVPMIREAGGWRLDIPDTVDAAKLKSNVSAAIDKISSKKAEWPADQDEAYRHVTHCILMAVFDKSADARAGAGAGAGLSQ